MPHLVHDKRSRECADVEVGRVDALSSKPLDLLLLNELPQDEELALEVGTRQAAVGLDKYLPPCKKHLTSWQSCTSTAAGPNCII